jgi:hypothetical protein
VQPLLEVIAHVLCDQLTQLIDMRCDHEMRGAVYRGKERRHVRRLLDRARRRVRLAPQQLRQLGDIRPAIRRASAQ